MELLVVALALVALSMLLVASPPSAARTGCLLIGVIALASLSGCYRADTLSAGSQCAEPQALLRQVLIPAGRVNRSAGVFQPEESYLEGGETAAFYIDATEVTNQQFAAFIRATGYLTTAERIGASGVREGGAVFDRGSLEWRIDREADWRHPTGRSSTIAGLERHPVVQVSFEDAQAYARWAGARLPTELEWERAARLEQLAPNDREAEAYARSGDPAANTWQGVFPLVDSGKDGFMGTAPVGCFAPNRAGLYDMIGNVWEWTSDWYGASSRPVDEPDAARQESDDVAKYVIKGGSHLCAPNYCARYRSRSRQGGDPGLGTSHIGFRTVRDLDTPRR